MDNIELSLIQKQFWILQNLSPETNAYNIPLIYSIKGPLKVDVLEYSINQLIHRYDMLRTVFPVKNNTAYQETRDVSLCNIKIDKKIINKKIEGILPDEVVRDIHIPFNLMEWPLLRVKLYTLDNGYYLSLVFHHIIADLSSINLFIRELSILYNSNVQNKVSDLTPVNNNYNEFSLSLQKWINTEDANKKIENWKEYLSPGPEKLELPSDFDRPKIISSEGKRVHFVLSQSSPEEISAFAKKHAVNNFTVLLTAYSILLHRLSNQSKFLIGVPFANRRNPSYKETFGCFVNITPVLINIPESTKGEDLLKLIMRSSLVAHQNQEVPFLNINSIGGHSDGTSLCQAGFTFDPPMDIDLQGTESDALIVEKEGAHLELFLSLWESKGKYNAYFQYSSPVYKNDTIQRFWRIYDLIVKSLIADPQKLIDEIDILPEEDLELITSVNKTSCKYENDICIHQKFEQQVNLTPFRTALLYNDSILNYSQLNIHANRVANFLINNGVKVEDVIGICMERSVEMMIGIFGILKAGGVYMPLNADNPKERLNNIISDSNPKFILTDKSSCKNLPINSSLVYLDDIIAHPLCFDDKNPETGVNSKNLAYIIYTSGSTGVPKGVMIEHHSVLNRLGWMQKAYSIDETDTLLQKTPITFDVSVWELFWWSFTGSKLAILPKGGEKEPETIIRAIEKHNVTIIHFVPSMFIAFSEMLKSRSLFHKLGVLRKIFMSGEALPLNTVLDFNYMRKFHKLPQIINLYGPTEATVDVSYYNCSEGEIESIYIGKPIDNTKLFVINKHKGIQPLNVPGELIITGVNLARGYLNKEDLTSEKFLDFMLPTGTLEKAYLTGDLAKLTPKGEIEYIGRLDNQVKIRGFRIELGDIEAKLHEHPFVGNCAVVAISVNETRALVAYISPKPGVKDFDELTLRNYLAEKLPDYMIPSYYMFLNDLPLTTSGKVDRKSLPKPETARAIADTSPPATDSEKIILNLWVNLLKIENIGIYDNFFDIGGNSLLAISLATLISKEFKCEFNTISVFKYPRIKEQSDFISGKNIKIIDNQNIEMKALKRKGTDFQKRRM